MPDKDWVQDFTEENGNYECHCIECGGTFYGMKGRNVCHVCFNHNRCGHTYTTFSNYVMTCTLNKNHSGDCVGSLMGSKTTFSSDYSSDEEQYAKSRDL